MASVKLEYELNKQYKNITEVLVCSSCNLYKTISIIVSNLNAKILK